MSSHCRHTYANRAAVRGVGAAPTSPMPGTAIDAGIVAATQLTAVAWELPFAWEPSG